MIEVRTRRGQTHRGRSPQTIARRLYGPRAWVKISPAGNMAMDGHVEAMVLTPGLLSQTHTVKATWLLDQASLDAALADDPPEAEVP